MTVPRTSKAGRRCVADNQSGPYTVGILNSVAIKVWRCLLTDLDSDLNGLRYFMIESGPYLDRERDHGCTRLIKAGHS